MKNLTLKEFTLFFLLPSLLYVGFVTDFTFNLFQPAWLWLAYNEYFLSLIHGHLDVPVAAIGREGQYIGGKAYMYYGLLPTLSRIFVAPFVDLQHTPVSSFSILLFSLLGNIALQASVLSFWKSTEKRSCLILACVSLLIWFGSGTFMALQNTSVYHEPYAASLCLVNLFLALLIRDGFFLQGAKASWPYAILAGLCIHARMPTALALYLATLWLIGLSVWQQRLDTGKISFGAMVANLIRGHWLAFAVLFVFGVSILLLNVLRFGDLFAFMGHADNYGYYLSGENYTARTCEVFDRAPFYKVIRIIPNAIVYTVGGWTLHDQLTQLLHAGYGRKEMPSIPTLLLWLAPTAVWFSFIFYAIFGKLQQRGFLIGWVACLSVGAIFQLTYPTIAYRYIAELWPMYVTTLIVMYFAVGKGQLNLPNYSSGILLVLVVLTLAYNLKVAFTADYNFRSTVGYFSQQAYEPEYIQQLERLDDEKIKQIIAERKAGKKQACQALKEELGLTTN